MDEMVGFERSSKFWTWLNGLNDEKLHSFYNELVVRLVGANGYVTTYNAPTSYCIGSHNNFALLGSYQQANGAVYHICPYIGKNKYPLQHCLSLLRDTIDHVEKYPSVAPDSGTTVRTTKYVLQHLLNQMNLYMELSDHQMVADVLDLPSVITSDKFVFSNPASAIAYQTHVQMHENAQSRLHNLLQQYNGQRDGYEYHQHSDMDDFIDVDNDSDADVPMLIDQGNNEAYYPEDVIEQLCPFKVHSSEERLHGDENPTTTYKTLVPTPAYYNNRGEKLKNLSRSEYAVLIGIKEKPENEDKW